MNSENPSKKSFKYYNKNFKLNPGAKLRTNRKYVLHRSESVSILIFFNDGFLNNHITVSVNDASTNRMEGGTILGYYKLVNDSIFFTTKSYYKHRPSYFKGRVNNDTLDLEAKYPKGKTWVKEKYVIN